ncbi:glycoside hydrolase family 16 protein [Lasiosphaeria hispida]|uniref:Glycoside hydrolase family 16 protein n=1 Tax=Lasiosphaeria hispida TaxID=260671 RepID=A0AAJ0HEQ2_9PEZI|nr:glycoside hydrolase family 16 protein [Lasiosphaeria hispida]
MRSDRDPSLRPLAFVVAAASLVAVARGAYPLTTDSNCGCYKTNATSSNYFAHHQFFDFRSLPQHINQTKPINDFDANALAPTTSAYFRSNTWTDAWAIQSWNNTALLSLNSTDVNDATVKMVNSPNNIFIERSTDGSVQGGGSTYMTMRTVRHDQFQSSSEFESRSKGYQFLSIRMLARTKGASGAVTAMFTYRPPPTPHNMALVQEADLEIRTRDPPAYVQYTNQPSWNSTSDIPEATRNASLPGGRRWSDWAMYRMDWTPGSSTWYVNGVLHSAIAFQAPRDPAQVMFNSWSDGGSWSGPMRVNSEAALQIQWIELVYNNTDPGAVKTGMCVNVCSIDETTRLGTPALITSGAGSNTPVPPTNPVPPTQPAPGACAAKRYDQCAGKNWGGCKACPAGTTCKFQNDYYSQCL